MREMALWECWHSRRAQRSVVRQTRKNRPIVITRSNKHLVDLEKRWLSAEELVHDLRVRIPQRRGC